MLMYKCFPDSEYSVVCRVTKKANGKYFQARHSVLPSYIQRLSALLLNPENKIEIEKYKIKIKHGFSGYTEDVCTSLLSL